MTDSFNTRARLTGRGSAVALALATIAGLATPAAAQDNGAAQTQPLPTVEDKAAAQDIIVTGQRAAQQAAVEVKRNSLAVSETIIADDVGKLPDQNVAESVRRLPGLSVANDQGEGRYVIIRGVNPNLVNVTVNGQTQPAPEPDGRQVKLDDIPSALIGAVTISKSITPDQDANAIGGAIDIRTLSAFDRREHLFMTARGQYGRYELGNGHPYEADAQVGGRFGNFGAVASVSYSKRDIESENFQGSTVFNANGAPDQFGLRDYNLTRERTGIVLNLDWHPSDAVKLYARGTYSKFTDHEIRDQDRVDSIAYTGATSGTYRGRPSLLVRLRDEDDNTKSVSGGGTFDLGSAKLDVSGAWARAIKDDPLRSEFNFRGSATSAAGSVTGTFDVTQSPYLFTIASFNPAAYTLNSVNYDRRHAQEDLWQLRADLSIPVRFGSDSTIKIGAKYLNRHKVNDRNFVQYGAGTTAFTAATAAYIGDTSFYDGRYVFGPRISYALAQAFADANVNARSQSAANLTSTRNNSLVNDYDVREEVTAGYAMAVLRLDRLTLIPGVRVEHTQDHALGKLITATSSPTQGFNSTGDRSYTDVFPGLNAKFEATRDLIFRAAVTTSLGRPNYPDLTPFVSVDVTTSPVTITQGNPAVQPYKAVNLDGAMEYYLPDHGLLSVGVFYKHIDNPIYSQSTAVANGTFAGQTFATANVIQPLNADKAIIKGIEFAAQVQFTFLPSPLDGFGVTANYTIVGGEGSGLAGRSGDFPLFFQSKRIASGQLTYEKYGITARLAYSRRSKYLDLIGASAATDQYTDSNGQLDARIGFAVGPHFEVYLEGGNLNDAPFRRFIGTPNQLVERERYGRAFRLGGQVKF